MLVGPHLLIGGTVRKSAMFWTKTTGRKAPILLKSEVENISSEVTAAGLFWFFVVFSKEEKMRERLHTYFQVRK